MMNVNLTNTSLQQRFFSGTNSIGGVHLPDFSDNYVFSKQKSSVSDAEYKKQIVEQAYTDFKNGQFQNKSEGFNKLMKKYTSEVSPDRKGIITSGLKEISRNKQSGLKPIDLIATILEGKVKYQKLPSGQTDYIEFYDKNGEMVATYSNNGWTMYTTNAEAVRQTEMCKIYNEAWGNAKRGVPLTDSGSVNSDYYNNIPVGRDLNNLPNTSSIGTTVGYQYDGLTEEDRFVQKVLQEHYDKAYKENLSHSDPMAYIESKYCDVTSPNFCSYMTEDQRSIAYRNEKRMLQTGGKYSAGFARYDYALRNYKDVYTGGSRSTGYIRNTDKEKQYARSVVNQQISNLFSKNGIALSKQADLIFSIDPYTYQLTVSGNADRDILSQIEKLLNEGDNAKNIWTHAWICMHDADNEIVNSQANMTKANQYSLWHEVYETTGYDARNATYKNGTFIAEDGTDLLALFKEKAQNSAGYELYSKRWLEYAKNGWKKENDLVLKMGFDSSGLYDIGQEKGYGAAQNTWMKGVSQSMFEARV